MSLSRDLAKGSSLVSVITLFGHVLSTASKLLISRSFGLVGFGQFALIMAFSRFLSTVVQLGYHQSIVHFISKYRTQQDWRNVRHFFVSGLRHILLVGLITFIILFLFRDVISSHIAIEDTGLYTLLFISSISLILAVNNFISGTLLSLRLFKQQAILFTSSFPALMILSLLGVKYFLRDAASINQFLVFGIVLNAILLIIAFLLTLRIIPPPAEPDSEKDDIHKLPKYAMPIWLSSGLQSAFSSSDRIMLGILSSISQVGIYGAGLTFSILFAFPLKAMGPVFQPYIIDAYARQDFGEINKLYNIMVRWSSIFVIPAFSGLICFGDHLVLFFGSEFQAAYGIMIILSLGQIVSTVSGIAGTMLNMTEKQTSHLKIMIIGFVFAIGLNLVLIPHYGALGAAVGTAISILIINVIRVVKLIKFYGLRTDYSMLIGLIFKFAPVVALFYWIVQHNSVPWFLMLGLYMIISLVIIYFSIKKEERIFILDHLRRRT